MSSHHTQKAINLHHQQVSGGRDRRTQKQIDRQARYIAGGKAALRQYNIALCFGFGWFAYMQFAIPAYLWYVLKEMVAL